MQHNLYLTIVVGVFECIGEQVGDDLVEIDTVYPCQDMVSLVFEGEGNVALVGTKLIQLAYAADKLHHIGLLTMQLHLFLVQAALVKNLVDQLQQALGIAVDGVDRRLKGRSIKGLKGFLRLQFLKLRILQFANGSHDNCKW